MRYKGFHTAGIHFLWQIYLSLAFPTDAINVRLKLRHDILNLSVYIVTDTGRLGRANIFLAVPVASNGRKGTGLPVHVTSL